MNFDEILAGCIAAVERGLPVEECLSQYPEYAAQLEPLLQIVVGFSRAPRPQISTAGFDHAREAMHARAHLQRQLAAYEAAQMAIGEIPVSQPRVARRIRLPRRRHVLPKPFSTLRAATGMLIFVLMLMGALTFTRNVSASLPSDTLYALKRTTENAQGVLMSVTGNSADWHALQVERRLAESLALQRRGDGVDPVLVAQLEEDLRSTLDISAALPPAERSALLLAWLEKLRALQAGSLDLSGNMLHQTIRQVETAAGVNPTPVILPTFTPTATATPTATPTPTSTATSTATETATATPTLVPTSTRTPVPPTATATLNPTATFTPRPTDTPTRRSSGGDSDKPTKTPTPRPTNTPTPLPTATAKPTATATAATTPSATQTPDITQTPSPTPDGRETPATTPSPEVTPDRTITPDGTSTPDGSPEPTSEPTDQPQPTGEPTAEPTAGPTDAPTVAATPEPTAVPTNTPDSGPVPTATAPPVSTPTAGPAEPEDPGGDTLKGADLDMYGDEVAAPTSTPIGSGSDTISPTDASQIFGE